MPKLWTDTIEEHRREVRDAVLDTTAALVAEGGLLSVTMSRIAEETGIGRATLYKYFPDVESILLAWHERQIDAHLSELADVAGRQSDAGSRLDAVLATYALIRHKAHGHDRGDVAATLHSAAHVSAAEQHLHQLIRTLIADAADTGAVRADVPADELASFTLNALSAASSLASKAAVSRLVTVTLTGLRAPDSTTPLQPN